MLEPPSRSALAHLKEAATAVAGPGMLGLVRGVNDNRYSVAYADPYGSGEYIVEARDLSDLLKPGSERVRQADLASLDMTPAHPVGWFCFFNGVRHIVALDLHGPGPPTNLWLGLTGTGPLAQDRLARLPCCRRRRRHVAGLAVGR